MRKGTKVIYQNTIYTVLEKRKNHVVIYNEAEKIPELSKVCTGLNKVKPVK